LKAYAMPHGVDRHWTWRSAHSRAKHSCAASPRMYSTGVRILLADDHAIVRRGLRVLLGDAGFHDILEVADGEAAIRCAGEHRPEMAILDLRMPRLDGISAARQMRQLTRAPATTILTMFEDVTCLLRSLDAGARAVLAKSTVDEELILAIHAIRSGRTFVTKRLRANVDEEALHRLRAHGVQDPYDLLTDREKGLPNQQVARALSIGVATVETHRAHLMEKLGLHNTAAIVLYACRKQQVSTSA
jgi:two-component system response regulator NreC